MYIEARQLVSATLLLLLLGGLLVALLLSGGFGIVQVSGRGQPAEITSVRSDPKSPQSPAVQAPLPDATSVAPAAEPAPPASAVPAAQDVQRAATSPVVADAVPGTTAPEEVVGIATVESEDTQINTRGFGDVGLQFQDVHNTAPITIVHISNQGNNNSNNVHIGNNDQITSNQQDLQSNRADGSEPLTASTAAP